MTAGRMAFTLAIAWSVACTSAPPAPADTSTPSLADAGPEATGAAGGDASTPTGKCVLGQSAVGSCTL
jgi:hypothetical protein